VRRPSGVINDYNPTTTPQDNATPAAVNHPAVSITDYDNDNATSQYNDNDDTTSQYNDNDNATSRYKDNVDHQDNMTTTTTTTTSTTAMTTTMESSAQVARLIPLPPSAGLGRHDDGGKIHFLHWPT
jgi:hypothetical protein